jgi:hypothetical protein
MIAYCGMNCSKCEGYLATQADNDAKREEVAKKWTVQYNTEIKPEQINCNGCKSEGTQFSLLKMFVKYENAILKIIPHIVLPVVNTNVKN